VRAFERPANERRESGESEGDEDNEKRSHRVPEDRDPRSRVRLVPEDVGNDAAEERAEEHESSDCRAMFHGRILPFTTPRCQQSRRSCDGNLEPADFEVEVRTKEGEVVRAQISAVPLLDDGHVVGIFGIARMDPPVESTPRPNVHLTPRQTVVLRELARGLSTNAIAARLGIAPETVRNHLRGIFRGLGVHTRLDAVLRAHDLGLVGPD
jgi:DNA-binding CsgD family transcriptional regulator